MSLFFFSMLQGLETFSACVVLDNIKIQIRNTADIIRLHGKLHIDNSLEFCKIAICLSICSPVQQAITGIQKEQNTTVA